MWSCRYNRRHQKDKHQNAANCTASFGASWIRVTNVLRNWNWSCWFPVIESRLQNKPCSDLDCLDWFHTGTFRTSANAVRCPLHGCLLALAAEFDRMNLMGGAQLWHHSWPVLRLQLRHTAASVKADRGLNLPRRGAEWDVIELIHHQPLLADGRWGYQSTCVVSVLWYICIICINIYISILWYICI